MSKINGFCTPNTDTALTADELLSIAMSDAAAGLGPKVQRVNGKLKAPNAKQKANWEARNASKV